MLTGSVTQASDLLHVSQPAVSQLLKQLEQACGYALFERRRNGMVPTPEATVLFEEVRRLFEGVAQVSRVSASLKVGNWGSLAIAGFPALTRRFLPEVVAQYCADQPNVSITLESRSSRGLIDAVATQRLDLGIGTLPSDRADVRSRLLRKVKGVCVMRPDHPLAARSSISVHDLVGERFVSLGHEDRSRQMIDKVFNDLSISRRLQIEAPQSDTACALVMQGAGVSIVDPFSAFNASGKLIGLPLKEDFVFELWLLLPAARPRLKLVDKFIRHVDAAVGAFRETDGSAVL